MNNKKAKYEGDLENTGKRTKYPYVILGGGLVAGYAAQQFAEQGIVKGDVCIISNESTLPYERPPLSKSFLAGEEEERDILINEPAFYHEHGIEVKLDTHADEVDFENKVVQAGDELIGFEKLLIATGSRPRTFLELDVPGSALENIEYLRQIGDARRIRSLAKKAAKAVVIGGGFIGMETTAVLQSKGVDTTLTFPEKRVWEAFFTPVMSAFFQDYYREQGVTILPEQEIESFTGNGRVSAVITKSGNRLDADLVVAGIGVVPNKELFEGSGLEIGDDGILVNRFLETNIRDVFAAGDVTRYRDVLFERPLHIEHWDNAVAQGRHVVRVMLGEYQPFKHVPYFFSDEFDLSYEFWGLTEDATQTVQRGDVSEGEFSVWWLDSVDRVQAAFLLNRPAEERQLAQDYIQSGEQLEPDWLREAEELPPV